MSEGRRFFISDIHLGGDKAWFKEEHQAGLMSFLAWIKTQANVKDLVLLGDLFDTWMSKMEEMPLTIREIAMRHRDILDAISSCKQGRGGAVENLFYVNGNHDMHVTQEDLNSTEVFGEDEPTKGPVVRRIQQYHAGLLFAEHGSRYTMFNAPDPIHDPGTSTPIGYFITRMIASSDKSYKSLDALKTYVDDALEAVFSTQSLSKSVIEALRERLGLHSSATFTMPDGTTCTFSDVQSRYADLFDRWSTRFGFMYAFQSLRAEFGSLDWFADRLCKKKDYRVVVLGHSHKSTVDADRFWTKDRAYANAGEWCDKNQTFVEVEKMDKGELVVKLWKMTPGSSEPTQVRSTTIRP